MKTLATKIRQACLDLRDFYHKSLCYRLSSVNTHEKTAILHIINKNIFIKQTFSEIIFNANILERLSCEHACLIGIYYGTTIRNTGDATINLKNIGKQSYLLKHQYGHYKIICENRDGTVGCLHTKTRKQLNAHPIAIAQDKAFINCFDANQACYIGMLAGIAFTKQKKSSQVDDKKSVGPYLWVVK